MDIEKIRLLKEVLSNDLYKFVQYFLMGYLSYAVPDFHKEIYSILPKTKRLVLAAPRGFAKAQSLKSKILTPNGWKLMGDIKVGDYVIGENGFPKKVLNQTPVTKMHLYRLKTRDGRSTLCNLDHLWKVSCPQNTGYKEIVKPLRDILKNYKTERLDKRSGKLGVEYRYFLKWAKPIEFSEKDLPLDPYTLGAWLGDGTSESGGFTTNDPEMLDYIPHTVTKCKNKYGYTIRKIRPILRKLNLLKNKHIPEAYLFGSKSQREALLQGLIDTDGTVNASHKIFEFCNKNKRLIDDVCYLIRSLGGTATIGSGISRCNGKEFNYFKITARCPESVIPVKLKRKRKLWDKSIKVKSAITSIEYECEDLGKCIEVEDKLYITDDFLLTHNSSISSIFYPIWCALFAKERDICIVSATEGLAVEMLRAIKRELESNRRILTFFGDMKSSKWAENHIILSNGVNIRARGAGGQIRGFRPSLVILDDIETDEGVESEEQRKKLKNWVFKACLNTLLPEGQFVVVGTILHPLSLLADLLTIKNGWNKLKFQAYKAGTMESTLVSRKTSTKKSGNRVYEVFFGIPQQPFIR